MTEEARVKHIYSGNVFAIAYLHHIKEAKPKSPVCQLT